jgi:hypothetical protein
MGAQADRGEPPSQRFSIIDLARLEVARLGKYGE